MATAAKTARGLALNGLAQAFKRDAGCRAAVAGANWGLRRCPGGAGRAGGTGLGHSPRHNWARWMSSAGSQDGHKSGNKTRTETIVDDDNTDYENAKWSDMTRGERLKYAVGKYGMYTLVGGTFAYVISKSSMWLTGTFMGLSFKTVGWWGFVTGYWAGIATTAALYSVTRGLYIRPENVRNKAFQLVSGSAQVQSLMGLSMLHPLKAGVMRAYSMDGGAIELDRATRRIVWRQPRVKMLFQVYGGLSHQAVVCAEAVRTWQGLNFDFVSVDFLTIPSEPPILVHGDPKRFSVEGQLRDLVQLKKSYV